MVKTKIQYQKSELPSGRTTEQYTVTIPKVIVEALNAEEGDYLDWSILAAAAIRGDLDKNGGDDDE